MTAIPRQLSERRRQIAAHFSRAANGYKNFDAVQQYFGQQLIQHLSDPQGCIVDLGCGPASLYQPLRALGQHYLGIDVSAEMLKVANQVISETDQVTLADAEALPLKTSSVDVCFANMSLQWCASLSQAVSEMRRVLKPTGEAAFNLPLDGSFKELQDSWRQLDDIPHTQPFTPLNQALADIEQAGVTGYHYAVVEHRQYFPDLKSLLQSVKGVGANFVAREHSPGLMTPRRFAQLTDRYEVYREKSGLPITWRVGHFHFQSRIN